MENSGISWTHHSHNFWLGCDKVAPECAHCYIGRDLVKQGREPWGRLYLTKTWNNPWKWEEESVRLQQYVRVFTCSESDFFHQKADAWRADAWALIKHTPHIVWLVLTKRPELIESRLPLDWPYANVWLGVSAGCRATLNKMDTLRRIPIHAQSVRWISSEPLLEDISQSINLDGFGWVVTGGESGSGEEYQWDATADWRKEFITKGRRTMDLAWARNLRDVTKKAGLPFLFKQVTNARPGQRVDALGQVWHEYPDPPTVPDSWPWKPKLASGAKHLLKNDQLVQIAGETK
jgi:protein gp37